VDDYAEVRSVTKSVMATLVGAPLREGLQPSIDAKLGDLPPQHRSIMDSRTERITVRQLLSKIVGYGDRQVDDIDPDRSTVPQLLKPGPENPPGAEFEYQDRGPHCFRRLSPKSRIKPRWTMPDGCCSSRLISRRGPTQVLALGHRSDDLVIHDLCLESQNVVGIPVAPLAAARLSRRSWST
jgi:hypothetical protein